MTPQLHICFRCSLIAVYSVFSAYDGYACTLNIHIRIHRCFISAAFHAPPQGKDFSIMPIYRPGLSYLMSLGLFLILLWFPFSSLGERDSRVPPSSAMIRNMNSAPYITTSINSSVSLPDSPASANIFFATRPPSSVTLLIAIQRYGVAELPPPMPLPS